jgi:hypothetical protein
VHQSTYGAYVCGEAWNVGETERERPAQIAPKTKRIVQEQAEYGKACKTMPGKTKDPTDGQVRCRAMEP